MLPLSELERVSLLFDIGEVHRGAYGRLKRVLDLRARRGRRWSCSPSPCPFVALGDLVGNRGPLFYRQAAGRQERHGVPDPQVPHHAPERWRRSPTSGPPRTTRASRRSVACCALTHLDELPQVINILRGDLSVVGPRPEQPHYVEELSEKLPFYDLRHLVRPGLTGWAQVKYGYAGDESDALEKLQYEFFYLRHQGLGLDLRIVGRTIRSVLGREGR